LAIFPGGFKNGRFFDPKKGVKNELILGYFLTFFWFSKERFKKWSKMCQFWSVFEVIFDSKKWIKKALIFGAIFEWFWVKIWWLFEILSFFDSFNDF
jgi:hypothetical protein